MTDLCAIQADYVNWRPVNGRKVLQLVFEVPLESTHDVLTKLGTPTPGESKWCAIALLDLKSARAPVADGKPDLRALSDSPAKRVLTEGEQPDGSYRQVSVANGIPKKWADYKPSQQAAILCDDVEFQRYFSCLSPETANCSLKQQLRIKSKKELDTDPQAAARFSEVVALYNLHRARHA